MQTKRHPGERFGRLVLLERSTNAVNGAPRWLCSCDCGNPVTVHASNLSSGTTKSCGCLRVDACKARERKKNHPTHGAVLTYYKRNAKVRGYEWKLDLELFSQLVLGKCNYCGALPSSRRLHYKTRQGDVVKLVDSNGIDRINNNIGYLPSNVVSCCSDCNRAKASMTTEEFIELARRIVLRANERSDA